MHISCLVLGRISTLFGLPSRLAILAALLALAGLGGLLIVHRWYARSGMWVTVAASLTGRRAGTGDEGSDQCACRRRQR